MKDFLVKGYAINEARLGQKQQHIETLQKGIKILSRAIEEKLDSEDLSWFATFAKGLPLLDDYDREQLDKKGRTVHPAIYPDLAEYNVVVQAMKADFDSAVFGRKRMEAFRAPSPKSAKASGMKIFIRRLKKKRLPCFI